VEFDITSAKNPKIKALLSLIEKSKERKERGLFAVEGKREIEIALESGFTIEELYISPEITNPIHFESRCDKVYSLPAWLYSKIAYRDSTEGVIAVFRQMERTLNHLVPPPSPLIIVVEKVEKPGNIGAVIRTADAVNALAVLICDSLTDIYNPNIIRSSLGGVFSRNVISCTSQEAFEWLTKNHIKIITAQLQDSVSYYNVSLREGCAIVMGAESDGLSQFWRDRADRKVNIPMLGKLDSLNVSVSAAVLCYEVIRQREVK